MRILLVFLLTSGLLSAQLRLSLEPEIGSDSLPTTLGVEIMDKYARANSPSEQDKPPSRTIHVEHIPTATTRHNSTGQPIEVTEYMDGQENRILYFTYNDQGQTLRQVAHLPEEILLVSDYEYQAGKLVRIRHTKGKSLDSLEPDFDEAVQYHPHGLLAKRRNEGNAGEATGLCTVFEYFFFGDSRR